MKVLLWFNESVGFTFRLMYTSKFWHGKMAPWTLINACVQVWLYLSGETPGSPNVVQVRNECPLGTVTDIIW
jgi:hypothetical protein